jgi:hypothetical protein
LDLQQCLSPLALLVRLLLMAILLDPALCDKVCQ